MPKRVLHMVWWRRSGWKLILASFLCGAIVIGTLIYRAHEIRRANREVCHKIHLVDIALQNVIRSSQPTEQQLLHFSYYRKHPSEIQVTIQDARKRIAHWQSLLQSADCTTS